MKLPAAFLRKMEIMLGSEFPQFLHSYDEQRVAGIRANRLKIQPDELRKLLPYNIEPIPWTNDGFYYNEQSERPAKHPYYYAGLYYIQEPSAMLPAELLQARTGERVLDLCAAPGGKSIQLAGQIEKTGLLVVNDIHPQRAKVLLKNIERYGVIQALVLNETPERIRGAFTGFFDKVLVDAPCSGEGMFRKEPEMMNNWSEQEVAKYAGWQAEILNIVPDLLRSGGEIVYSTCTFSKEENELQMERFFANHPDYQLQKEHRLWPHQVKGEGHFAAKIKQIKTKQMGAAEQSLSTIDKSIPKSTQAIIEEFSMQVWGDSKAWQIWLPDEGQVVER